MFVCWYHVRSYLIISITYKLDEIRKNLICLRFKLVQSHFVHKWIESEPKTHYWYWWCLAKRHCSDDVFGRLGGRVAMCMHASRIRATVPDTKRSAYTRYTVLVARAGCELWRGTFATTAWRPRPGLGWSTDMSDGDPVMPQAQLYVQLDPIVNRSHSIQSTKIWFNPTNIMDKYGLLFLTRKNQIQNQKPDSIQKILMWHVKKVKHMLTPTDPTLGMGRIRTILNGARPNFDSTWTRSYYWNSGLSQVYL